MSTVVFLGPTLPHEEAARVLDATYLPPARQGDVLRAVRAYRPRVIGLIDGAFLDVPAVWHRELLWAMSEGVHVLGAASMGALRAAELAPLGMRGVGRIFEAFRDGRWPTDDAPFEDDDEVAVIHAPVEAGARPLSDALVDLRATLDGAVMAGVIDEAAARTLVATMKALHFPRRSFARLSEEAQLRLDGGTAVRLSDWLARNRVSQKRLDAIELLQELARLIEVNQPSFHPTFHFERALVWEKFVHTTPTPSDDEAMVLEELRLDPAAYRVSARAVLGRLVMPDATADPTVALETFRGRLGLWRRADLDAWIEQNVLDMAGLERLLRREAALDAAHSDAGSDLETAMLEHLRLSGAFPPLIARARAKRTALGTPEIRPPASPALCAALDWYFGRMGESLPHSIAAWAREHGWREEHAFVRAVWREYLFAGVVA
jgi:hypothetical protein